MLVESRNRVMRLFEQGEPPTAEVVAAVEADVALAVTVLRLAKHLGVGENFEKLMTKLPPFEIKPRS